MKAKKIPVRMCSGCSERKPKNELVRIVRRPDGEIALDETGKKPGRGAYLCGNGGCLKLARKARRLERAFKCQIPEDVYGRLEEAMSQSEG
ncbi:MAG: YlxR family protein [Oscillospiraceae bacterium]|nr:YlxR family protein [Oscillospiraceae bacterium]